MRDLPAVFDPNKFTASERTHPDRPFGIQQIPSGVASPSWANTRRSDSEPSSAMLKAVKQFANVSATMKVLPSGLITLPFGKPRPSATTRALSVRRDHDDVRRLGFFAAHQVVTEIPDI